MNGTQTLDENLADNGGLKEAFKAFKKLITRGDQLVSVKEYTLEQLFFIAYGTVSKTKFIIKICFLIKIGLQDSNFA